jgi:hypothetical protein
MVEIQTASHKMGRPEGFLSIMQRSVAVTAIGPSSLRNQGASGVIDAARNFLAILDLRAFQDGNISNFLSQLDKITNKLLLALPKKAQNWGAARKAVNLFLRDALYNQYLANEFNLQKTEPWLEIPLDGAVARGLKKLGTRAELPVWPGLKRLSPETSGEFQVFAKGVAKSRGLARVHLDIYLWLEERK